MSTKKPVSASVSQKDALTMLLLKGRTVIVLVLLLILFSIASDAFFTKNSLLLVAKHVSLYGILAIGMTYVIISGGIDLSVGSIVGFCGMFAGFMISKGFTIPALNVVIYPNVPLIVLLCLIVGVIIGAVNGLIITRFNVAPFIATLGMMYVLRGFANLISNGATFANLNGNEALGNAGFEIMGRNIMGIPFGVIALFTLAVVAGILLKKTPFGWHVFSIGGNAKAAQLSGVKVNKVKIYVYMFSGFCAALVGLINTSQLVAAHPRTGESYEMNAIAATVLGGTSMAGGMGGIGGTIIGAFVIGVINDGMVMCGVSEFWQMVVRGAVIVVAVIVDQFQKQIQDKMELRARNENR